MKNRSLEVSTLNDIKNISDLANVINCSLDEAAALINENEVNEEVVNRFCEYFKITKDYFYCITEVNNYERL